MSSIKERLQTLIETFEDIESAETAGYESGYKDGHRDGVSSMTGKYDEGYNAGVLWGYKRAIKQLNEFVNVMESEASEVEKNS